MQQLPPYTSKTGETFQIAFEDASVPEEADFWGFFFPVVDSQGRKRSFRCVVKKSLIADQQEARNFTKQLPLRELHSQLDQVVDGRGPLFFPDVRKGWEVF